MKPIATPVLGGMVSSLIHVLVVTPVIFYWLRTRSLAPADEPTIEHGAAHPSRRWLLVAVGVAAILAAGALVAIWKDGDASSGDDDSGQVVQVVRAGELD